MTTIDLKKHPFRQIAWALFALLIVLSGISVYHLPNIKFNLELEQFFPQNDPDFEFFLEFKENFEADDNFLLVAISNEESIRDLEFMRKLKKFSIECRKIPYVTKVQGISLVQELQKTPFGPIIKPAISLKNQGSFEQSFDRIKDDPLYIGTFISKELGSTSLILKTKDQINFDEATELMTGLNTLVTEYDFDEIHKIGRASFQTEMAEFEKREIMISGIASVALVLIVLLLIFRHWMPIALAFGSFGISIALLAGYIMATGSEINALAAMFPVIMVIVGTSDVIHLYMKYFDEVKNGKLPKDAVDIMLRHIGMATLLTSITTAMGFATLATSNMQSVTAFGLNSAAGVIIAYAVSLVLAYIFLPMMNVSQSKKVGRVNRRFEKPMIWLYHLGKNHQTKVIWASIITICLLLFGITKISMDYRLLETLPRSAKLTEDFRFFEKEYGGFRPLEFAVEIHDDYSVHDFKVLEQINALEEYLSSFSSISTAVSPTLAAKLASRIENSNRELSFPTSEKEFNKLKSFIDKIPSVMTKSVISEDGTKARISTGIEDIGSMKIKKIGQEIDQWVESHIDKSILTIKRTGSSVLLDKNSEYLSKNIFQGLGLALFTVSFLMFLLFQNWKFLVISVIPNLFPLIFAAAMLGFLGIDLEAGVSIVFAIIFGIAVDDTIHFLSKYKLEKGNGLSTEDALYNTCAETGKAILLTSLILFFGFLVLLFSDYPPSNTIGLLIAVTLLSALLSDILLIPLLIRLLFKDDPGTMET